VTRMLPPYPRNVRPAPNRSGYFNQYNQGKRSIQLDISKPEGVEIAKRIVAMSDVAAENFAGGVIKRLGLGYEDPSWPATARESLCLVFPSLLLSAGLTYARRILRRPSDGIRLFTLPGQRQLRKASIVFVPTDPPRLELQWTGSNRRLSHLLWERPSIPGVWSTD